MIDQIQNVSEHNDPNSYLGVEGGYTACLYFTTTNIESGNSNNNNPVKKGTDAGGCIEVYSTLSDAMNRCEYLASFDNTLLYSGSYAIVGTMVIRTSYKHTNEEQVQLTSDITNVLTQLE